MPTISLFYGMVVQMYWRDHPPPHVHVIYQSFEAAFDIETGQVLHGEIPPTAARIVRPWLKRRRIELLANWERGRMHETFKRVPGADVE